MHGKESCAHSIKNQITLEELRQEMGDESKLNKTYMQHQIHIAISFYSKNKSELPSNITITKLSNVTFWICRVLFSLTKSSPVPF
jgi:hypothetical protein